MDQDQLENSRKKSHKKSGVIKKRELRFNKHSVDVKKNSSDVAERRRTNKKSTRVSRVTSRASNLNLVNRVSSVRRFTAFSRQPTLRFQPTYRLEPKRPFKHDDCYSVLQNLITFHMQNYVYNPKTASRQCLYLSEEIKLRVKKLDFDRYKIICVLTIGQKYHQTYKSVAKFLWDSKRDGYANFVFDSRNFFCNGTIYAIYYE